jgi:hypothetical protein
MTKGRAQVSIDLFFWVWLNVGVPLVGPAVTLALVAPIHGAAVMKQLIAESVNGGQLFWIANGLSASTIYEAFAALRRGAQPTVAYQLAIAICAMICFACSFIVTMSMAKAHTDRVAQSRNSGRRARARAPQIAMPSLLFLASIVVAAFSAFLSITLHTYIS